MTPEERQKRLRALDKSNIIDHGEEKSIDPAPEHIADDISRKRKRADSLDAKHKKEEFKDQSGAQSSCQPVAVVKRETKNGQTIDTAINLSEESSSEDLSAEKRNEIGKLRFLRGQVMLTASDAYKKQAWHISLEELLDRNLLRKAVLAAFQIDLEWTLGKINLGKTPIHLVFEAKDQQTRGSIEDGCKRLPKVLPIFPPMLNGANCMHSK